MENIKCNLCGSDKSSEIYKDDNVRYVMCDNCSLVFLNPRPTLSEYKKFYSQDYQNWRHKLTNYEQALERRKKKSDKPKIKRSRDFEGFINKDSRVLEIGSGWGTLLNVIKNKFDCEVAGIEISELAAQVAKNYYGLNIYNQTFENYLEENKNNQKFDFIIMVHVLEHFIDASHNLFGVSQILSDNGCVYIAIPNIMSPAEPLDRFFQIAHCYYFTPLTLKKMLSENGFKIIWLDLSSGEIKAIAVKTSSLKQGIDASKFERVYSKEKVLRAIKRQDLKYKALRFFKKISEAILPKKISLLFKKMVIKILRKIEIIKV